MPTQEENEELFQLVTHLMPKISHVSGALSFFGSSWIMMHILFCNKNMAKTTYHRIMLRLSFFDLVSSFWYFMSSWAQPTSLFNLGSGTALSCNIAGFSIYLGNLTIPMYNASLAMYYYLTICCGWREELIKKSYEKYIHIFIPFIGITSAAAGAILQLYGPYYFYCFPTNYNGFKLFVTDAFVIFYFFVVSFSAMVIFFAMFSITFKVQRIVKQSDRYSTFYHVGSSSRSESQSSYIEGFRRGFRRRKSRLQQRSSRVKTMAYLYTIPFLICWFIPMITQLITFVNWRLGIRFKLTNPKVIVMLLIYLAIALPIQGFLNWAVYVFRGAQSQNGSRSCNYNCSITNMRSGVMGFLSMLKGCYIGDESSSLLLGQEGDSIVFESEDGKGDNIELDESEVEDKEAR